MPRVLANEIGPIMNVLGFVRSQFNAAYALGVILLGAVALTALQSLVPGEELTTLRSFIPGATPIFQLVLFGWIGVAIGRFSIGAKSSTGQRDGQETTRRETAVKEEKIDRVLRAGGSAGTAGAGLWGRNGSVSRGYAGRYRRGAWPWHGDDARRARVPLAQFRLAQSSRPPAL